MHIRALSRDELKTIDARAVDELGLTISLLMENAGHAAALWLHYQNSVRRVLILCGSGDNGGDGGVVARHLDGWGHIVEVCWVSRPEELRGNAAFQSSVLTRAHVAQTFLAEPLDEKHLRNQLANADWVVDGLLGTGLTRPVEGLFRRVIELINQSGKPVLALDVPSGLNADTGQPLGVAVRATATATFVAPKLGFTETVAKPYVGEVVVCDIGVPRVLLQPYLITENEPEMGTR